MHEKLVAAIAFVAGVALATGAVAQSSGSSQPSSSTESSSQSAPSSQSPSSSPAPSPQPAPSQPSPSTAGSSSPADQAARGVLVDASALIGATVRSPQGKDIGKVDSLMVDPKDGRIRTVVIRQGATLGVGGKSVSMPWESVKVGQDGDNIVVTAEQQMLDQAPAASPRTDSKSESNKKSEGDKSDSKK